MVRSLVCPRLARCQRYELTTATLAVAVKMQYLTAQTLRHHCAVTVTDREHASVALEVGSVAHVAPCLVYAERGDELIEQLRNEVDVVDICEACSTTAVTGVPGVLITVRIDDDKVVLLCHGVHPVTALIECTSAAAAVQEEQKRCWDSVVVARWNVDVERASASVRCDDRRGAVRARRVGRSFPASLSQEKGQRAEKNEEVQLGAHARVE